jgi:hypothetical protein
MGRGRRPKTTKPAIWAWCEVHVGNCNLGRYCQAHRAPAIVAVGHTRTYGRPNGQVPRKYIQNRGTPSTREHAQTALATQGPLSLLLLLLLPLVLLLLLLLFLLQPNTTRYPASTFNTEVPQVREHYFHSQSHPGQSQSSLPMPSLGHWRAERQGLCQTLPHNEHLQQPLSTAVLASSPHFTQTCC